MPRLSQTLAVIPALLATAALLALPNGQMLKERGPCGKALCACAPQLDTAPAHPCCHTPAETSLHLVAMDASGSGGEAPGAFQIVFHGLIAPAFAATPEPDAATPARASFRAFFLSATVCGLPTPPPRA